MEETKKLEDRCQKACYPSRKVAKRKMQELNLKFGNHGKEGLQNVYFCTKCESWHITSMNKKRSRDFTRKLK